MASLKVPAPDGSVAASYSPQPASSNGPKFLKWIRRSRSDIAVSTKKSASAKSANYSPTPVTFSVPVPVRSAKHEMTLSDGVTVAGTSEPLNVNGKLQVNGTKGAMKRKSSEVEHGKNRQISQPKMIDHRSGINRTAFKDKTRKDNLNFAERFLKEIHDMHTIVKTYKSDDIWAELEQDDRNAVHAGILGDAAALSSHIKDDVELAWHLLDEKVRNKGLIDDRKDKILERLVRMLAVLPDDGKIQKTLTCGFIAKLWNQLEHPPMTYLGSRPPDYDDVEAQERLAAAASESVQADGGSPDTLGMRRKYVFHQEWRYRTHDGANNSRVTPQLGMAGSPYARTVEPKIVLPADLPAPGEIFEQIMAASSKDEKNPPPRREHPAGVSSMLFYLASIIIHDCFETNPREPNQNMTSSYLDLSPLYGKNGEEQMCVRSFKDGLLKKDTFAEPRILGFPPGVAALLICFNRFHNYIAVQLKEINEGGRFSPNPMLPNDQERALKIDHDLFQTARLITCGLYINIVLVDYVRTILNLNKSNSPWRLDPRANLEVFGPNNVPQGIGNQVSVEFNLLYRWHSATSLRDEGWTEKLFKEAQKALPVPAQNPDLPDQERIELEAQIAAIQQLKEKEMDDLSTQDLAKLFHGFLGQHKLENCSTWPLYGNSMEKIERTADGSFDDDALNALITEGTEDIAGAYGAQNVPRCMKAIEMAGISVARSWNVASLNEFRQYFGLKPHKTFEDICQDKSVASSLEALYGHPDLVELYPGLVVEDMKQPMEPGSGLCPGLTISQAILSDAVNLVRGDRFYTIDCTAASLTNWGFTQIQPNSLIAGGGVMYKLLMKAFPGYYRGNSVYAMYPFTIPGEMMRVLEGLGQGGDFSNEHPSYKPIYSANVTSYDAVKNILSQEAKYNVPWGKHIIAITGQDFMLGNDSPASRAQHAKWLNAMEVRPTNYKPMRQIRDVFETITTRLLRQRTIKRRDDYQIDAVADIGNMAAAIGAAAFFHIPLKCPEHHEGVLTAPQLYTIMSICFAYTFLDIDESKDFALQSAAIEAGKGLKKVVDLGVKASKHGMIDSLLGVLKVFGDKDSMFDAFGAKLIRKILADNDGSIDDVTAQILPTMAGMIAPTAQQFAQLLDLFFSPTYAHHWSHIQSLSRSDSDDDFNTLVSYVLEGMRLSPAAFGVFRTVNASAIPSAPATASTAHQIPDTEALPTLNIPGCDTNRTSTVPVHAGDTLFLNFGAANLDPSAFPSPLDINLNRPRASYLTQGAGMHTCIGRELTPVALAGMLRAFGRLEGLKPARAEPYVNGAEGVVSWMRSRTYMVGEQRTPFRVFMQADGTDDWPFPTTFKMSFKGFEGADGEAFACDGVEGERKAHWWDWESAWEEERRKKGGKH